MVAPARPSPLAGARAPAVALVLLCLAGLWAVGVRNEWRQNTDVTANDQSAYLDYAADLRAAPDLVAGDRNRMPVFPYLVARSGQVGTGYDDAFTAARWINIAISVAGLATIGWLVGRRAGPRAAFAVVVALGFGVFLFKAPFAQAEPLFYLLFTAAAALMVRAQRHPSALVGAACGLVAGLAHLTKGALLPLIALFVVAMACTGVQRARTGGIRSWATASAAFAVVLLATLAPYAADSARLYGSPTYNVNSSVYAWTGSWGESSALPVFRGRYVGDRDERPSPARWFERESVSGTVDRELDGMASEARAAFRGGLLAPLVVAMGIAFGVLAAVRRRDVARWLGRHRVETAFLAAVTVAYVAMFAWWVPQADGPRFVLTLLVPASVLLTLGIARLGRGLVVPRCRLDAAEVSFTVIGAMGIVVALVASLHASGSWYGGM